MLPAPFNQLPETALKHRSLEGGQHLFRQGDAPRAVFFVSVGEVRLLRHTEAGLVVLVFRAKAGDTFAEAALFSTGYHCDAVATQRSTITAMGKPDILAAMENNPTFALALTHRFAHQVQAYRRRFEILAISSAEDRVLTALSDGWLTGKVVDFAIEVGLTHEATFRALSQLVRDGRAVKTGRGRYEAAPA